VLVVQRKITISELLEREARHRPGEMIVVEAPAQHRERKGEKREGKKSRRDK
jgi:hypothetical protein